MNKLILCVLSAQILFGFNSVAADPCPNAASVWHYPPHAKGTIPDQTLSANSTDCGPNSLQFDITPYFESHGEPLVYCLSNITIDGDVSNLKVTLNPFDGMLNIPVGWFGVNTTITLKFIAKNPYGSGSQLMKVFLTPCGG